MDVKNLSSNWKKLQVQLRAENPPSPRSQTNSLKRKRSDDVVSTRKKFSHGKSRMADRKMQSAKPVESSANAIVNSIPTKSAMSTSNSSGVHINAGLSSEVDIGKYVAIDCEMVGVGPKPDDESALARVSIVNYNGVQIYDSFVLPLEPVTDWRTHVSGITPKHMREARTLEEVQTEVAKILKDRIVVGHSVRKDFEVLLLDHPKRDIRDTARHPPYRQLAGGSSPKLKILASELLGLEIQSGEHSSIEDARAAMLLFRRDKEAFERENAKRWPTRKVPETSANSDATSDMRKSNNKKKKKKKKR